VAVLSSNDLFFTKSSKAVSNVVFPAPVDPKNTMLTGFLDPAKEIYGLLLSTIIFSNQKRSNEL
jgi:hypothetical protein